MLKKYSKVILGINLCWLLSYGLIARAAVSYPLTRIIIQAPQQQITLPLTNIDDYPILVQAWTNQGDFNSTPEEDHSPFVVVPPMFRLDSKGKKIIRIIYDGSTLAADRETLFWLNIYEIPAVRKNSVSQRAMSIATRFQLKIFYRPIAFNLTVQQVAKMLNFRLVRNDAQKWLLQCKNNSPLNASLASLVLTDGQQTIAVTPTLEMTVPPFSHLDFKLPTASAKNLKQIQFSLLNDDGFRENFTFNLNQ